MERNSPSYISVLAFVIEAPGAFAMYD
jgi:hypothetical protein